MRSMHDVRDGTFTRVLLLAAGLAGGAALFVLPAASPRAPAGSVPPVAAAALGASAPQAPSPAAPAPATGTLSDADARALLGRLVGVWSVVGRSFDANGQPDADLSGSAVYNWTLGGLFLGGEQVLTNGSAMLQWVDFLGYNQTSQSFSRSLLSDRDPVDFCSNGTWDPARRVLTFITESVRGPDGTERRIRAMLDLSRDDQPGWELNYLVGSGANERLVGTVGLLFTRSAGGGATTPGMPIAPGAPGAPGAPAAPGGIPRGAMTPEQVQQQLNGVLRQKQQMQQQIEDMRRQMQQMSGTIRQITK